MCGDREVGKTSIVSSALGRASPKVYVPTLGVDHGSYKCVVRDQLMTMGMWDLSGDRRFDYVAHTFLKEAAVVMFCFDLNRSSTFDTVRDYVKFVNKYHSNYHIQCLVGVKSDLERNVSEQAARAYASSIGAKYYEINSKEESDVVFLLHSIANDGFELADAEEEGDTGQQQCPCM